MFLQGLQINAADIYFIFFNVHFAKVLK